MSDCDSDPGKVDFSAHFINRDVSPSPEPCHVTKSLIQDIAGVPEQIIRRERDTSFLTGLITGLIVGLGVASLASAYTFRRVPFR